MKDQSIGSLTQADGETLIKFHHICLGLLNEEHKAGFPLIWKYNHGRLKARVEK
jgi:hypothetical protein